MEHIIEWLADCPLRDPQDYIDMCMHPTGTRSGQCVTKDCPLRKESLTLIFKPHQAILDAEK